MLQELSPNARLGLAEAVTQEPSAAGLLLPDGHADVVGPKLIAGVAEVHRLAGRIRAESIMRQLNSSKGDLCQQRFDRLELNRCSAFSAGRAGTGAWLQRRAESQQSFITTSMNPEVHFRVKGFLRGSSRSTRPMTSRPGAVPLTANDTPFNRNARATPTSTTPHRASSLRPKSRFNQGRDDCGDQKQRSRKTTVQRAVATEVDEACGSERHEQQRVGIGFEYRPSGFMRRPIPYSTANAAAQNHMAAGLVQQL